MKNLFKLMFLLLAVFTITSCSSDDNSDNSDYAVGSTFKIDGDTYDMSQAQPNGGIIQIIGGAISEEGIAHAQILLAGMSGMKQGNVIFHLSFIQDEGISATYTAGESDQTGHYDSESSMYTINEFVNGSQEIHSGDGAEGTLKITHNSGSNYTVEFSVTYDDGVQAEGNITQDFAVQQIF